MSLSRPHGLRKFGERLTSHPKLGLVSIDRLARRRDVIKYDPIREISVVWDGKYSAAGSCLESLHVVPKGFGFVGIVRREGDHCVRSISIAPEDHHAVDIIAPWLGCPLEADEGREDAWIIEAIGIGGGAFPH